MEKTATNEPKDVTKKKVTKFPFGIMAGALGMICSYLILAIVVIKVVSYLMIINSGGDDGLGESPILIPLFIGAIVLGAAMVACIILYILKNKKIKKLAVEEASNAPKEEK